MTDSSWNWLTNVNLDERAWLHGYPYPTMLLPGLKKSDSRRQGWHVWISFWDNFFLWCFGRDRMCMNVQMDRRRKIANVTGDILGIEVRKGLSLCFHRFFLLGSLSIFRFLFFTPTLLIYCLPVPPVSKSKLKSTVYPPKSCGQINEIMWLVNLPGGKYVSY